MEWVKIGSLLEKGVISTVTPTFKLQNSDIADAGDIPVISQEKDFINGYTNNEDVRLKDGPFIVFGDHTECLKFVNFAFVQGADGIKIFKTDPLKMNGRYLYYALCGCYNKTGFYERHFKLLKKACIPDYDLGYQQKIASVLSTYDDLIENNKKRIKILESMAQELYKEWFVRFRFPGLEKIEFENGIPKGWKKYKLGEILKSAFNGGWGEETPLKNKDTKSFVIRGTDINDVMNANYAAIPVRYDSLSKISDRQLRYGDIVMELSNGNIDNIGRTLFIDDFLLRHFDRVICASFCKCMRFYDVNVAMLVQSQIKLMRVNSTLNYFKNTGTNGINNFNYKRFLKLDVVLPDNFKLVKPLNDIRTEVTTLRESNFNLKQQRDLLLSRLMSGKLEVPETMGETNA